MESTLVNFFRIQLSKIFRRVAWKRRKGILWIPVCKKFKRARWKARR